jgi:sigma-B regulation protein RsbU (phosphoserine phosphatase)
MGHGFHTGLMVFTAKSCLCTQIKADYSISSVMSTMNDTVYGFVHGDLFMGLCYVIVNLEDHTISFSNAGHAYPYHYHIDTKQVDTLESNACLLGVLEYQYFETTQSEWADGDIFVLYTDGITEARSKEGEEFGTEKLKRLVIENAHLPPAQMKKTILHEFDNFCQGVVQADDVSLVIVRTGM